MDQLERGRLEQVLAQEREAVVPRASTARRIGDSANGKQAHERRGQGHLHGASDQNVSLSSDMPPLRVLPASDGHGGCSPLR